MDKVFRYLDFEVYQDSKRLYKLLIKITKSFDRPYLNLKDQMLRASLSIPLNIAEGSAKNSDKDFNRYVQNSLGSTSEVFSCLDISKDLDLITNHEFEKLSKISGSIARQLGGLSKKLKQHI